MDGQNESDAVDIQQLAAQMLGQDEEQFEEDGDEEYFEEDEDEGYQGQGHPAWRQILDQIPEEYHSKVMPTLADWDAGVSRRFQQLHDEFAPLKEFEETDPEELRQALKIYKSLNEDPSATWETIGRVYGLSPQKISQATSDDDFDLDSLPDAVKNRLMQVDQQNAIIQDLQSRFEEQQALDNEAAEDEALENVLEELAEEFGDFDEDYVVGLIAAGVDPEEAVGRFQEIAERMGYYEDDDEEEEDYPQIMSAGGGIPNAGDVNVNGLSNQDTQELVAELLRLSRDS